MIVDKVKGKDTNFKTQTVLNYCQVKIPIEKADAMRNFFKKKLGLLCGLNRLLKDKLLTLVI